VTDPTATISLPCRYYRVFTDPDVPSEESNFGFVEQTLPLPVHQTALVLVDVWAVHYIDSMVRRIKRLVADTIVPALQAARQAGITVIHAPSPWIVQRRGYQTAKPELAEPAVEAATWPPAGFGHIYRGGEWAAFGRPEEPRLPAVYEWYETDLDIAAPARPEGDDLVISSGPELHAVLEERRILHLIYVGFCANWCLVGRDYGIMAMNQRGYNLILLRDATTGIESADTVDDLLMTNMTIREIETKWGWSATSEAFAAACVSGLPT
jgi:nicotinamidase-related amidase